MNKKVKEARRRMELAAYSCGNGVTTQCVGDVQRAIDALIEAVEDATHKKVTRELKKWGGVL